MVKEQGNTVLSVKHDDYKMPVQMSARSDDLFQSLTVSILIQVPLGLTWLVWDLQEVAILKSLSFDKNVVQFYGCMDGPCPLLILEYMEVRQTNTRLVPNRKCVWSP